MAETSIVVKLIDETRAGFQGIQRNLDTLDNSAVALQRSFDGLKTAAAAFVGVVASKATLDFIDTIQTMDNRLKLVTKSQGELNTTFENLFDVAQRTRAPLTETVDLFSKLKQNQDVSRQSTEDLTKVTEAFTTSLAISGTSGQAAAGAITQFAQAMASGKLQGDEFRSMAEANPKFLAILAQQTGIAREELKELASKGFITAEIAAIALKQALPELQAEMANTDTTVRQAITGMTNEFQRLGREFLDSSGTSTALVEAIQYITANMENLIPIIKLVGIALAGAFVYFAPWTAALAAVAAGVVYFADKLGPLAQMIVDAFGKALDFVIPKIAGVGAALVALVNLENPFTAYTEASNKASESFGKTEGTTKALGAETQKLEEQTKKTTGVTDEMKTAIDRSGLSQDLAKTKLGDYLKTLDEGIKLAGLDKDAREAQIAVNKALTAAEEDAQKKKQKLSEEEKARIEATVRDKIAETQAIRKQLEEQTKDREDAYKAAVDLLKKFSDDAKKQNEENLSTQDKYTKDLLDIENAYNTALINAKDLTAKQRQKIEEDYHNAVKGLQTRALDELYKEYDKYNQSSKTQLEQYVDARTKIEEAYRIAMQNAENLSAEEIQKIEERKNAALLGARSKFGEEYRKLAEDQRKTEMSAEEKYTEEILKLNKAQQEGLIKSQEEYDLVRRKIEKDYREETVKEYSSLYGVLTEKILQFTGMNQKEFGILRDTVKLVFGVDINDIIKQAFAEFIKYVIGFRTASEGEIGGFTAIFAKIFGKKGNGAVSVSEFADEATDILGGMKSESSDIFGGIGSIIKDVFSGGLSVIGSFVKGALDLLGGLGKGAGNIFSSIGSFIGDIFSSGGGGGGNIFTDILGTVGDLFSFGDVDILGGIGDALGGIGSALGTVGLAFGGISILEKVGDFLGFDKLMDSGTANIIASAQQSRNFNANNTAAYGRQSAYTQQGSQQNLAFKYQLSKDRVASGMGFAYDYFILGQPLPSPSFRGSGVQSITGPIKSIYGVDIAPNQVPKEYYFAMGGIVNRKTAFPMDEGIGYAGEAGPEAILPLQRGANGELGVQAVETAGDININFTINAVDARGVDQLLVERRQMITNMVRSAMAERGRKVF